MAHGDVHYLRLTANPTPARTFYQTMFGWRFGTPLVVGGRTYYPWDDGAGPGGDIVHPVLGEPVDWLPFVEVTNINTSLALATANGATVLVPVTSWVGGQKFAVLLDPFGARFGLWEL